MLLSALNHCTGLCNENIDHQAERARCRLLMKLLNRALKSRGCSSACRDPSSAGGSIAQGGVAGQCIAQQVSGTDIITSFL